MQEKQQEKEVTSMPLIGEEAPEFKAQTTMGPISFPEDYKGKWTVLFSHPGDFTPVCTTEFLGFQDLKEEFDKIDTQLLGYSVDGIHSHIEWVRNIKKNFDVEIEFPIIGGLEVAHLYGMIHSIDTSVTVRAVFVINPVGKISAMIYYPLSNGRDIKEVLRLVKSLQKSHDEGVATPEAWPKNARFNDEVIIPPAASVADAMKNENNKEYNCKDWYICTKKNN